jgi:L-ribulose-5-phosphate 3-epimerase
MQLGVSSYSFKPLLTSGELSIEAMFDWLRMKGARHLEIATFSFAPGGSEAGYDLTTDSVARCKLQSTAAATGVAISGICLGASFIGDDRDAQVALVKRHVELTAELGAKFLRHDVVPWSLKPADPLHIERELPKIIDACREVADFAAGLGVTTSVEDHGFFINGSARINQLIAAVDRPNFRFTLDVGNFECVDEDGLVATRAALPHASFVHIKDFYKRRAEPGPGWLTTLGGQFIRGSIFGYGDLPTEAIVREIKASGYDGFISLEYEANEPTLFGIEAGLNAFRRMWGE